MAILDGPTRGEFVGPFNGLSLPLTTGGGREATYYEPMKGNAWDNYCAVSSNNSKTDLTSHSCCAVCNLLFIPLVPTVFYGKQELL